MKITTTILCLIALILLGCNKAPNKQTVANKTEAAPPVNAQHSFQTYSAEALFNTTAYVMANSEGFAISNDDNTLLISSDDTGIFNAYSLNLDSAELTQLTRSANSAIFAESYFPNDNRFLYTADNGGDELNHIWVQELDGKALDLTPTANTKALFLGWSGDQARFYLLTNERDPKSFDLYAYNADDYHRELIFQNDNALSISAISKDGQWLAAVEPRTSADANIYLKNLTTDEDAKLITPHQGNIKYGVYSFTPDSQQLVISTDEHGEFYQAWLYDLASAKKQAYETAQWDVSFVGFSQTGRYKYSGINQDAETKIKLTDITTGKDVELPNLPAGNIMNVRFSSDDKKIAFLLNGDTSPSDVYTMNIGDTAKRLTYALNEEIDQANLVEAQIIRYKSFDGTEIPSTLYKPKQASAKNKVPAIVFVHGGPGGQTRKGYSALIQHLVNHGYAVLGANNRGSSGYGKSFFHMDDKAHGEGDLQDIVWGRKYLESLEWVDKDSIGVMGGSYGGFMVAAALAFEPEVFDVGINIFGVTNWVRTLKSIPPWWESYKEALYDEMGDPATDEERHKRISPLFHAQNITKPLLVVQGANDPRVLQVESDELVAAVKENNVPVEYVLFPDEGHGFLIKANRIKASNAYVEFLNTYLKKTEK
ncbi:alpha/beta fold hydrolase [Paraglaciecola sp. 2405UD69-4]|uniref:S9 family peptidase n=1 Tax=Paraglaciecola sp. 2405UD69-4 TaxID=3391836 RepID=UPI0039C8E726